MSLAVFLDQLHHASWWTIIRLFCTAGILTCLLCMIPVLCLMLVELKGLENDLKRRNKK